MTELLQTNDYDRTTWKLIMEVEGFYIGEYSRSKNFSHNHKISKTWMFVSRDLNKWDGTGKNKYLILFTKRTVLCCLILLWFHRQRAEVHPDCHQQIKWQVAVGNFTELTDSELTRAVSCHLAKITHSWPALGSSKSHAYSFSSAYCQNPNDSITQPQLELSWTWKWHANHPTTHHHTNSWTSD